MSGLLQFTVHGQMTSSNAFKAPDANGRLRKTKEAKEDARRVREIATVAATSQAWEIPQAVAVDVIAYNSRLDADNISKVPYDALKGVAWHDDGDVMDTRTRRRWDREGERYEAVVRECEDQRPGRTSKPRRPFDGLPANGVITDFAQRDEILRKAGIR
jgi:Holliday junction resolvase RusA-like endonuclease